MTLAKIRSESLAQSTNLLHQRIRHRPSARNQSQSRHLSYPRRLEAQHQLRLRQNLLSLNRPSPLRQKQTSYTINLQNPRVGGALRSLRRIIPSEIGRKAAESLGVYLFSGPSRLFSARRQNTPPRQSGKPAVPSVGCARSAAIATTMAA